MELLAVVILIGVAVYFLFLRPKKKPAAIAPKPPVPETWPPEPVTYDPPVIYDPTKPIELTPVLDLSSRDRRIVEMFETNGEAFTAAKDVNRVSGDPAVASFDSAVARGVLETGKTSDDRHGYRVTQAARRAVSK